MHVRLPQSLISMSIQKLYTNRSSFAQSARFSRPGASLSIIANVMQEKITLYFSLSVVLKYKVPVYCYCKKFGKIKKMLDEDQVTALNLAKNGHNLLITGQAGCGKTFLVKEIAKQLKN